MENRAEATLGTLRRQVRDAVAATPNRMAVLVDALNTAIVSDADPYLLLGALTEGAVRTLAFRVPPECRSDTALALISILLERMSDEGMC